MSFKKKCTKKSGETLLIVNICLLNRHVVNVMVILLSCGEMNLLKDDITGKIRFSELILFQISRLVISSRDLEAVFSTLMARKQLMKAF